MEHHEGKKKCDYGVQPLDGVMVRFNISNTDLVRHSKEQLTHKMVQKGRKGRRLTLSVKLKILRALQTARPDETFSQQDLFNYHD